MRKTLLGLTSAAAVLIGLSAANAQSPLKIGVILPFSGQFADTATQLENGMKLYMKQHGDVVAGRKLEIIKKDVGGINPPVAKRLAQELVVRDKVDILGGFVLTPNAIASADVSKDANKFMVVMNAATSVIITKSPVMVRTEGRFVRPRRGMFVAVIVNSTPPARVTCSVLTMSVTRS